MAEVQLKRKITLRRKEKPAEFTFDGLVKVNGEVDDRRGRKVYEGDIVSYDGKEIKVIR